MPKFNAVVSLILFLFSMLNNFQQENKIEHWDQLIKEGKAELALEQIKNSTDGLIQNGLQDSLSTYLEIYGRALEATQSNTAVTKSLLEIYQDWSKTMDLVSSKRKLAMSLSSWYKYQGNFSSAFETQLEALDWAEKESPKNNFVIAQIYMSLGGLAVNTMNLPEAKKYLKVALDLEVLDQDPESIYLANSSLGNISYFTSNLDSAAFYYRKALLAIDKLPSTPKNQFYRNSIVNNNLAGVQMAQGDYQNAEISMQETISSLEKYQVSDLDPAQYKVAISFYFQATDNLAGLYKQKGAYHQALQLLEYSFRRKAEEFGDEDIETAKSRIFLGQLYFEILQLSKARANLNQGLQNIRNSNEVTTYYQADAVYALARLEDYEGNELRADSLYLEAKALFEESLQGEYDVIFLGFLKNYSKFLAENQQLSEAVRISKLAGKYLEELDSENLYLEFEQSINLASIYELGHDFSRSYSQATAALELADQLIKKSKSPADSLQMTFQKPTAILIKNRSSYALEEEKDVQFLQAVEKELREGLKILDSKTDLLVETLDINILLDLNRDYFDFLNKIELELYQLSQNQIYLDRLLAFHEYARYRQIRTRLQKNKSIKYGGVPEKIIVREEALKKQLQASLHSENQNLTQFRKISQVWDSFMDSLRISFPQYYQLHFESSESILSRIYTQLNPEITYLRYLKVGEEWKLLILNGNKKKLISLESVAIERNLSKLSDEAYERNFSKELLFELYGQLWMPASAEILSERVVIIPDGSLFNLSFETMTFKKIQNWDELASSSLLAKHSISYQYGLLFIEPIEEKVYENQMVAFAPGFFDQMKKNYRDMHQNNKILDQAYLQLIPQPFTRQLVNEVITKFGGKAFLESYSTAKNFKDWAGNNQIIHIGTHAISDNVNPGDSRLIFAKSQEDPSASNEIYSSEIYKLDLRADLTVLLACESGKPTYSPGEGMVSLAHAFNYSGTKSLLMGLWKIDEKASVRIASLFYGFLEEGKSKDEALRLAKLEYLSTAKGRELAPSFWAGLILLGNNDPITISPKFPYHTLVLSLLFLALLLFLFRKRLARV